LITTSELGNEESSKLNRASLLEANKNSKQLKLLYSQVEFSKVKAVLLEVNSPLVLNIGHCLSCVKTITYLLDLKQRSSKEIYSTNYIRNVSKEKSLLPKENKLTILMTTGKPGSGN
jgi:hypothetical protein